MGNNQQSISWEGAILEWRADDSGDKFWTITEIIDGFAVCPVFCPFCE